MKRLLLLLSLYICTTGLGCQGTTDSDGGLISGKNVIDETVVADIDTKFEVPPSPERPVHFSGSIDHDVDSYVLEESLAVVYGRVEIRIYNSLGLVTSEDPHAPFIVPVYYAGTTFKISLNHQSDSLNDSSFFFLNPDGNWGKATISELTTTAAAVYDTLTREGLYDSERYKEIVESERSVSIVLDWIIQTSGSRDLRE